jgi:hypothetical protein
MCRDRYVVLNRTSKEVIDSRRGIHSEYVFSYRGQGVYQINNTCLQNSRELVNISNYRVMIYAIPVQLDYGQLE